MASSDGWHCHGVAFTEIIVTGGRSRDHPPSPWWPSAESQRTRLTPQAASASAPRLLVGSLRACTEHRSALRSGLGGPCQAASRHPPVPAPSIWIDHAAPHTPGASARRTPVRYLPGRTPPTRSGGAPGPEGQPELPRRRVARSGSSPAAGCRPAHTPLHWHSTHTPPGRRCPPRPPPPPPEVGRALAGEVPRGGSA